MAETSNFKDAQITLVQQNPCKIVTSVILAWNWALSWIFWCLMRAKLTLSWFCQQDSIKTCRNEISLRPLQPNLTEVSPHHQNVHKYTNNSYFGLISDKTKGKGDSDSAEVDHISEPSSFLRANLKWFLPTTRGCYQLSSLKTQTLPHHALFSHYLECS